MSDTERDNEATTGASAVSRKDRKKLEKEQKYQEQMERLVAEADQVNKTTDSPFSVTHESEVGPGGSRNISISKVSVSVNGKTLFKDTNVKLSAGSRYGLMGPNGRGKSTILRLITNRELPIQENLDILLVEQEQEFHASDLSATEAVVQSHKLQTSYLAEVELLRNKLELTDEDMERLKFLEDELIIMGASQAEARARRILFGLGFPTEWHDRPTKSFSGGWRKRIALASAVYIEPDVLLLDEPTNHLDLNAVIWLESYLTNMYSEKARRPKTLVVVSHDAGFLDAVCTHMVHIENYKLNYYRGAYSGFAAQVEQHHQELDKKYTTITKQIQEKKRNGKSNEQVEEWLEDQIRQGKIDREYLEKRRDYVVNFPFPNPPELRDGCIIKLENVSFNYPEGPTLFTDVSCALWKDSRITLCGPNGIGKSTLLNLMTGVLESVTGHISINRQVRIGRYNQHFVDKLPLEKTGVEYMQQLGIAEESKARALLGSFGLEGLVHKSMIATLSGGQKARVALAAISAELPHFLLFDEPTNHLDVESIEALCSAINNFKGGVLVVTHDARLIQETNMQLWIAGDKNVKPFDGGLEEYKDYVRSIYLAEEERRDDERQNQRKDKLELKQFATAATAEGVTAKEARDAARAAAMQEDANDLDDMLAVLEKKKKEKSEKKDKKVKKSDKEGAAK
ncbi:ABC transporter, putative [Bodo saltans]|uniref:ABC transporter, putative n=1 Tax=Bodo saltans TaxID=75058 RepID=A0A0S4JRN6_BODSA|nr:ABC transporter, putative [Bodo saltans]|eukprot:CUG92048.1 ABC transporter, putative [Bodo saltans]